MPIDYSIYSQMQAPDIAGGIEKGMRMSDMIKERKQKQALQDAYQAGNVVGPDGKTSFDPSLTASALAKAGYGKEAMDLQRQTQADKAQQFEMQTKRMDAIGSVIGDVKDPASYAPARKQLISTGLFSEEDIPVEFDPGFVNSARSMSDTWNKRQTQERELQIKETLAKQGKTTDPLVEALRFQQLEKAKREAEESEFKKSAKGRLQNMNSGDKQRYDNVVGALSALTGMEGAYAKGDNTFRLPMTGDNDFTRNRTVWEEMIGRMQSGGAINDVEANRFRSLVPTPTDSAEQQKAKLAEMRRLMEGRFSTFGFDKADAGDLGLDPSAVGFKVAEEKKLPPNAQELAAQELARRKAATSTAGGKR